MIIEDLHDADQALVDLVLAILAGPPGPVLILGTAWAASLDDPGRQAARLPVEARPDRVERLTDAELGELSVEDLTKIVEAATTGATSEAARQLAEHYANPLAIEIACTVPRIVESLREGRMSTAELRRLPRDVEALHRASWKALPSEAQTALSIAALCTPQTLSPSVTGDAWNVQLLITLINKLDWLPGSVEDVQRALAGHPPASGWVREASAWLRRFHEPLQYELARTEAEDLYSTGHIETFHRALAAVAQTAPAAGHEDEERLLAQLRVALAIAGRTEWDDEVWLGFDRLLEEAADTPSMVSQARVIDLVRAAPHDPTDSTSLHRQQVLALALAVVTTDVVEGWTW